MTGTNPSGWTRPAHRPNLPEWLARQAQDLTDARERSDRLLQAVLALAAGLDLDAALHRLVTTAMELVHARYGAVGVLGEDGHPARFVPVGIDEAALSRLGSTLHGCDLLGVGAEPAVPLRLDDLATHPAAGELPPIQTFLRAPVGVRGQVFGWLYLAEKTGGTPFTDHDEHVAATLAQAASIAIDDAIHYEQAQRRQREVEAISEITTELLTSGDPDEVLHPIAARALELCGAGTTLIAVPTGPDLPAEQVDTLAISAGAGEDADRLTGGILALEDSLAAAAFRDRAPASVPTFELAPLGGPVVGFGPTMVLPLRTGEDPAGVLIAARRPGAAAFEAEELSMAAAFADHAALALGQAHDQWRARQLDVLTDRDRIARELHDHVIQRLFAVGLGLQAVQRRVPQAADRLGETIDDLHEIITEIRGTIHGLRTEVTGQPARQRLHRAVEELTGDTLRARVRLSGPLDVLPSDLAEHAEAVVREAVSNAVQHAHASVLTVTVSLADDLVIEVTDDGIGIPTSAARSGLANLAHRAAECGGSFTAGRRDSGGTHLRWAAPLPSSTG